MDTNLTLELFIGRGMIDKSLAKDIKEEMIASVTDYEFAAIP